MVNKCIFCSKETDEQRYCLVCGMHLCWEHVGRISVAVHNNEGMRETAFYMCPRCMGLNNINIHDLLRLKQKHNPDIETIPKVLTIMEEYY